MHVRLRDVKNSLFPSFLVSTWFLVTLGWEHVKRKMHPCLARSPFLNFPFILSEKRSFCRLRNVCWCFPSRPGKAPSVHHYKRAETPLSSLYLVFFSIFWAIFGHKPLREHKWGALGGSISGVLDPYRGLRRAPSQSFEEEKKFSRKRPYLWNRYGLPIWNDITRRYDHPYNLWEQGCQSQNFRCICLKC